MSTTEKVVRRNPIDHPNTTSRSPVTAGMVDVVNVVEGTCQVCGKQMVLTACGNIPVYACLEDRVVLPLKEK